MTSSWKDKPLSLTLGRAWKGGSGQPHSFLQNLFYKEEKRRRTEKQYGRTGSHNRTKPSGLGLGSEKLDLCPPRPHHPPLSPRKLPQHQQLHALHFLSACFLPISLWGQSLPRPSAPKHRPAGLQHQIVGSPSTGPPVTLSGSPLDLWL